MLRKYLWKIRQILKDIWVRVLGFGVVAILAAVASPTLAPYVPDNMKFQPGAEAVEQVLKIMASSMLAVTTFSLSIAVQAFSAAASTATPRATALLQQDLTTQSVLSTFLGAFLFSLMGIIGLEVGFYSDDGQVLLFVATVLVVATVIIALLRWIGHLINFGRMNDTLARVEEAATKSVQFRIANPCLQGVPIEGPIPPDARLLTATRVGYLQHLDVPGLHEIAEKLDLELWVSATPGSFVMEDTALLYVAGQRLSADEEEELRAGFTIGAERNFDQDPRFGLVVMSEIASRALSPAVNDPGTAIDVLGRLGRILSLWQPARPEDPACPRVHVPTITGETLINDAFHATARDGAAFVEVQMRLRGVLRGLSAANPDVYGDPVKVLCEQAFSRCEASGMTKSDLDRLSRPD